MSERVTDSGGLAAALLWALALAWCGGIAFFAVVVAASKVEPPLGAWIALAFFGVVGLHLVTLAVRATRSAAAFRNAAVDVHTATLGGNVAGSIQVPEGTFYLTLTNWHRDDSDELVWESPAATIARSGPFCFDVPFDCEPTSATASWRLIVESPDGRHSASFPVTVQQTAESSPAQTRRALRPETVAEPDETKVRIDRGAASTTVRFPLPSWTARWYVIVLAVAAAAYLAATFVYPEEAMRFIGIGTVILLALMPLPTLWMMVRRIDAERGGLTFHYVLPRQTRLDDVRDVDAVYVNGALHYELTFEPAKASSTIINLRTRREADWVAYELRRALK
jgi:hypothetical protein